MKKILSALLLSTILFAGCLGKKSDPLPAQPAQTASADSLAQASFKLDTLTASSKISSPLSISGQAKGSMFFEGSFPVSITDSSGKELGSSHANSTADWMTEKFIPFTSTITFKTPSTKTGFIVLKNDNPSGLPENEHSVKFPISFK